MMELFVQTHSICLIYQAQRGFLLFLTVNLGVARGTAGRRGDTEKRRRDESSGHFFALASLRSVPQVGSQFPFFQNSTIPFAAIQHSRTY